ncbi:MAG: phospholipase D-like domain-containing protein [Sulfurimonas sp.]|nr:phospholipase D-like domain-containing protein [Sulfurimonas sp.]
MNETLSAQSTNLLFYHSFIAFGALLALVMLVHMLYHRRTPSAIIAWILSLILIPYIAMPLYFIIGLRKRKNRYKKSALFKSQTFTHRMSNETFTLYTDGVAFYEAFMNCIKEAKHSISISAYIFEYDKTTKEIIKALVQRADDGVEIKILLDSLGSILLYFTWYRLGVLKNAGVKVRFFMPIFQMPLRNYINLRNHRKIYIFDNEKVLSGGANLSDAYLGALHQKERWEDIMFLVEGASVRDYFDIFASDWFYASGEKMHFTHKKQEAHGENLLQVIPSGPDVNQDILYEMLLSGIYQAHKKITIITPYFIPNSSLMEALIIAHHRGVDVKLITPKEANHTIVNLARSSYMRELEEAGIKIYLYNGAMLHAKAILFDEESVLLGSVNFDNRSLFLNYEVATFVYSPKIIREIEIWSDGLMANASFGTKNVSTLKRVFENLMRIIAPQL